MKTLFAYVDPRNEAAQKEMESSLHRILEKNRSLSTIPFAQGSRANTGIIPSGGHCGHSRAKPKRDDCRGCEKRVSQETNFSFNVIVVDNHSTDGTTGVLSDLTRQHAGSESPHSGRTDLAIGGCWNEALNSDACGRYAVQLDSDDLYSTTVPCRR